MIDTNQKKINSHSSFPSTGSNSGGISVDIKSMYFDAIIIESKRKTSGSSDDLTIDSTMFSAPETRINSPHRSPLKEYDTEITNMNIERLKKISSIKEFLTTIIDDEDDIPFYFSPDATLFDVTLEEPKNLLIKIEENYGVKLEMKQLNLNLQELVDKINQNIIP